MFILKLVGFLLKALLKISLLPILIVAFILQIMIKLIFHIVSFGVTGIVLIGIYTIVVGTMNENWELTITMGIVLTVVTVLALAAGVVVVLLEDLTSHMISFMFS